MARYKVTLERTLEAEVEVRAETEDEAAHKVLVMPTNEFYPNSSLWVITDVVRVKD